MEQMGVRYRDHELDDIRHLWRCVGHFVGVEDDFIPVTSDEYVRIEALYALTSPGADDGDRDIVTALTEFQVGELSGQLPTRWGAAVVHGFQRAFVGDTDTVP